MQTQRISTTLVVKAEELLDLVRDVARREHITSCDIDPIESLATDLYLLTQANDAHLAHIAAVTRTGPMSRRSQSTRRDMVESLQLAARLRERPDRRVDPSAA